MHVFLKQLTFTYDDEGVEIKTTRRVPVSRCPESFYKTDYEKKFYKSNKGSDLNCVNDDSIYLEGTRDSKVL